MDIDSSVRYKHHKPPYKNVIKCHRGDIRKIESSPCGDAPVSPPSASQSDDRRQEEFREQPGGCGLLCYRKWWERVEVDIAVNGELITGTPVFIKENTLRVINNDYSFFIPMEKVDYIRTTDGLRACFNPSSDK